MFSMVEGGCFMSRITIHLSLLTALALPWLAVAQTGPVYSVNVMGFQQIPLPPQGLGIGASPYLKGSPDVNEVLGEQLTTGPDMTSADAVYFFDPSNQVYRIAYRYDDGTNAYWRDNNSQTVATNLIVPGSGFWIRNNQSTGQSLIVYGQVNTAPTSTVRVVPGLQLLSYPYATATSIGGLTLGLGATKGESLEEADALYLWDTQNQRFQIFYYYTDGSLVSFETGNPATNVITAGSAFWFKHQGAPFDWVENSPYSIPSP